MAARRQRKAFARWVRGAALGVAVEGLASRLRSEYSAQIPDVLRVLDGTGLRSRCDRLDGEVAELQRAKCSRSQAEQLVAGAASALESKLEDRLGLVHSVRAELLDHHESVKSELLEQHRSLHASVAQAHERHDEMGERLERLSHVAAHGERLDEHESRLSGIRDALSSCVTTQEVQSMLQDILLMWNSIKQLDVAKADRKDVDSLAAEALSREKQAAKKLQDVHVQVTGLVQEEVSRVDDKASRAAERVARVEDKTDAKWIELDGKAEDSAKQFQRWEEMWEKLASCVEELVAKTAEIQQNAAGRLPPAPARPPGRPLSALRSSRADGPRQRGAPGSSDRGLPESASMDMLFIAPAEKSERAGAAPTGAPGRGQATEAGPSSPESQAAGSSDPARWMAGARCLVDAALDQTVAPGSARARPARPRSASSRRSVDRSMG